MLVYLLAACGQTGSPDLTDTALLDVADADQPLALALEDIAEEVAFTPQLREHIDQIDAEVETLEALGLGAAMMDLNGRTFRLDLELSIGPDAPNDLSRGFYVAPDPDRLVDAASWPAWRVEDSGVALEWLSLDEELGIDTDLPVVILSAVELPGPTPLRAQDNACAVEAPTDLVAPPVTEYLCLCGVYLSSDQDPGSNEEFELYVETWSSNNYGFDFPRYAGENESSSSTYQFRFDGAAHTDEAGNSRTFTDVNDTGKLYCADTGKYGIAVGQLSSSCYHGLLPIEDDTTTGTFVPSSGSAGTVYSNCGSSSAGNFATLSSMTYRTPSTSGTESAYIRYSTTSANSDDNYGGYYRGFSTSTSSSVTTYTASGVTLYMARSSSCSSVCTSWASSSGCN